MPYTAGMRVLYIDSLFWLELTADTLLLWASGKLCAARRHIWRLGLAGTFGAAYAVLTVFFTPAASLCGKAAALLGMLLIAYGGEKRLWRLLLSFLCMCAVFSGVTLAVTLAAGKNSARALLFSLGVSLGVCSLPFRFAGRRGGTAELTLRGDGGTVTIPALLDTGNELREPISGRPVILASEDALLPLFPAETRRILADTALLSAPERLTRLGRGFRLLPVETAVGTGLTLAFRVSSVAVDGRERGGGWAAFSPQPIRTSGGCCALICGDWGEGE